MIGFLAKKHSGKDTASNYVSTKYGYTKRAFAEPLKKCVQEMFGFTREQLYTDKKDEIDSYWKIKPRDALQVMGTDIVRDFFPSALIPDIGKDFLVNRADAWYKNNMDKHKGLVVWSDVRFQNEVDYILNNGGKIYKIEGDTAEDSHLSEFGIDFITNYTDIISNDGSIEDLYMKIDNIMYRDHIKADRSCYCNII